MKVEYTSNGKYHGGKMNAHQMGEFLKGNFSALKITTKTGAVEISKHKGFFLVGNKPPFKEFGNAKEVFNHIKPMLK